MSIDRLRTPMSAQRRTDMEFAINRAIFYWSMIGVTSLNMVLTAYVESMRLSGMVVGGEK